MKESALFVQSFDLASWLLQHLDGEGALVRAIHADALALLDHVVLALKNVERRHHLDEADAVNALLRVRVRLAHQVGLVDERRMLFLTERLDEIGRQLGGWMRHLDRQALPPSPASERHR